MRDLAARCGGSRLDRIASVHSRDVRWWDCNGGCGFKVVQKTQRFLLETFDEPARNFLNKYNSSVKNDRQTYGL